MCTNADVRAYAACVCVWWFRTRVRARVVVAACRLRVNPRGRQILPQSRSEPRDRLAWQDRPAAAAAAKQEYYNAFHLCAHPSSVGRLCAGYPLFYFSRLPNIWSERPRLMYTHTHNGHTLACTILIGQNLCAVAAVVVVRRKSAVNC